MTFIMLLTSLLLCCVSAVGVAAMTPRPASRRSLADQKAAAMTPRPASRRGLTGQKHSIGPGAAVGGTPGSRRNARAVNLRGARGRFVEICDYDMFIEPDEPVAPQHQPGGSSHRAAAPVKNTEPRSNPLQQASLGAFHPSKTVQGTRRLRTDYLTEEFQRRRENIAHQKRILKDFDEVIDNLRVPMMGGQVRPKG